MAFQSNSTQLGSNECGFNLRFPVLTFLFNLLLFFKVFLCLFSPSPGTFPFIYYSTQSRIVFVWGRDRIGRNKYQANVIDIHSYIEEIEHTAR